MKKMTERTKSTLIRLFDGALAAATLLFALQIMSTALIPDMLCRNCCAVMLLTSFSKVMAAFTADRGKLPLMVRDLCFAFILSASTAVSLFFEMDEAAKIMTAAYYGMLLCGRVFACFVKRRVRSIIVNVILCLLIALLIIAVFYDDVEVFFSMMLIFSMTAGVKEVGHIISVSFAEMRLSVIMKIVRKTYAVEILLGLVLIMVAFSFVFVTYEADMETMIDALWYCFSIVTTIGFGDIAATSIVGRLLTVILGIYGIVVVALITSIIVNFYNEVKDVKSDEAPEDAGGGPGDPRS